MLRVNEIFGPTIQGEGLYAGQHCLFVRLYDCNLTCNFCDTPYTWANNTDRAAKHRELKLYPKDKNHIEMTTEAVLSQLYNYWDWRKHPTIIVLSGGEPIMQSEELTELCRRLHAFSNKIHVETAGTIIPHTEFDWAVDHYTVSPKLLNSGNPEKKRDKPAAMAWFRNNDRAWFKFVVRDREDMDEAMGLVKKYDIPHNRVQFMPEGSDSYDHIAFMKRWADYITQMGCGISPRMHTWIWGDERAR
jgi:organic radical activating enzyme